MKGEVAKPRQNSAPPPRVSAKNKPAVSRQQMMCEGRYRAASRERVLLRRRRNFMPEPGLRRVANPDPVPPQAKAPIEVLAVGKERGVEAADLFQDLAAHQKTTPRHETHVALRIPEHPFGLVHPLVDGLEAPRGNPSARVP